MRSISNIVILSILVICLSPGLLKATEKRSSSAEFSNSSQKNHFSNINVEKKNSISSKNVKENPISEKWKNMENSAIKILSTIYNESLPFIFEINTDVNISKVCKTHMMTMLTGMKEFKYWAIKMLDSFGKLPTGIESGTFSDFGDYDQCLDVNVPGYFEGQYCNLDMILPLPKRKPFTTMDTILPELMSEIKPDGFFTLFARYGNFFYFIKPRTSICVPSTCSKEEIQTIANKAVKVFNLSFGLRIENCEILNPEVIFDRSEIIIMIILGIFVFLAVSATVLDVYLKPMSKEGENTNGNINFPTKFLLCFSMYTNTKALMKPSIVEDSIMVFHGMRVITLLYVIAGHTIVLLNFHISGSIIKLYASFGKPQAQFLGNGTVMIETFFFISSTIQAYQIMKMKQKINIKKSVFRRIWRLVPTFMLVIGCAILTPHLGSGPVWNEIVRDRLAKACREKWWTNLLFINNFFRPKDQCLFWLWYIPVDFHLYIISLLVLIPMKSNPVLAFTINFLIMLGAMASSAALHAYYKLTPMPVLAYSNPEDLSYFIQRGYYRTYVHCSSVCIGLMVGYFLAKRPRLHIPMKVSAPLWMLSLIACVAVRFGVYRWNQGHIPSTFISVLYAGGSKILWTASIAWVTIACETGNGGIVTKILSWSVFRALSRLSYMIYLVHVLIHLMHVGSTRSVIHINPRTFFYMYIGNIISSILCAFVLHLLFEAPFMALDKLMFPKRTLETSNRSNVVDKLDSTDEPKKNETIPDNKIITKKIA